MISILRMLHIFCFVLLNDAEGCKREEDLITLHLIFLSF